jgi:hypothetical protein
VTTDVPVLTPVTVTVVPVPVNDTSLLPALHVPPVVASLSVMVEPWQAVVGPLIELTAAATSTVAATPQPLLSV